MRLSILAGIVALTTYSFCHTYSGEKNGVLLAVEDYSHTSKENELINKVKASFYSKVNCCPIKLSITNNSLNPLILAPEGISLKKLSFGQVSNTMHRGINAILRIGMFGGLCATGAGLGELAILCAEIIKAQNKGYYIENLLDLIRQRNLYVYRDESAYNSPNSSYRIHCNPGFLIIGLAGLGATLGLAGLYKYTKKKITEGFYPLILDKKITIEPGETIERFIFVDAEQYNSPSFTVSLLNKNNINNDIIFDIPWGI